MVEEVHFVLSKQVWGHSLVVFSSLPHHGHQLFSSIPHLHSCPTILPFPFRHTVSVFEGHKAFYMRENSNI